MNRDKLLDGYIALRVMDNPLAMRAARVHLGTASFGEKWRHFWRLPPTKEEQELADSSRKLHKKMVEIEDQYGHREKP